MGCVYTLCAPFRWWAVRSAAPGFRQMGVKMGKPGAPLVLVGPVYPYRGGIAYFTTQLGLELRAAGHPLRAVSFARQYPAWLYPGKTDKDPSSEHPSLEAEFLLDPLYPWTWLRAARAIAAGHPALVFIQWWTTFWGPALFCLAALLRARGIPLAFIVHNVIPHEARFYDRWIGKAVLSRAQASVCLSPKEEQRLRELLPGMAVYAGQLPSRRLSQVRLERGEARARLGLPARGAVLLFFGIVRPYKGLGLLLEALALLAQAGPRPCLLVAGEFWEDEAAYRRQVAGLGLEEQVRITNRFIPNEETALYFSAADLFVAPYLEGTQSGVIRVALDYGLPVLASDRIITEALPGVVALETFPAGDAPALAAALAAGLRRPPPEPAAAPSDGWPELLQVLERAVRDLGKNL